MFVRRCAPMLFAALSLAACNVQSGSSATGAPLLSARASSVEGQAAGCPSTDFATFLKVFASDEDVRQRFTASHVLVTDWRNPDETGQGTQVISVGRSDYAGFTLRYRNDGFHDLGPDGDLSPKPSEVSVSRRGDSYFVKYIYNLSEGNSWLFKPMNQCWFLVEDPEPSDP